MLGIEKRSEPASLPRVYNKHTPFCFSGAAAGELVWVSHYVRCFLIFLAYFLSSFSSFHYISSMYVVMLTEEVLYTAGFHSVGEPQSRRRPWAGSCDCCRASLLLRRCLVQLLKYLCLFPIISLRRILLRQQALDIRSICTRYNFKYIKVQ